MARHFDEPKLVIASHNEGKVREIAELLEPYGIEVVSAGELGLPEPEETGTTFRENAELKAHAAAQAAKLPALADDSGLAVAALEGAPGVFSARWAGADRDFTRAMAKLEAALSEHTTHPQGRSAAFVCALTLAWPDGHAETFEGTVSGHVTWPPRGTRGFGYDPVFVPEGRAETFGEMEPTEKHEMSHRADAFRQLVAACFATE